ncbi:MULTISPECIES: FxsA family protein [Halomonadaceae]|uniref:FxsA family protein n=1 Tax=Halomonadaceae TaxID=28256 RepID=UPI0015990FB2|nr:MULTISPECIES: FxsA family protein [Halomonas]QJQ94634.1 FxsA family protein [Halomonas sp. PA5]
MPFLLLFTVFALLDFVILFSVGSKIGLLTTLVMVLGTGFIGLHLVRREGVATLQRAQQRLANGELPSSELMTGAAMIFGGALLMAPGFLSDALGFMCLLPRARRVLGLLLARLGPRVQRFHYRSGTSSQRPTHSGDEWHQSDERAFRDASHDTSSQEGKPLEGDFIAHDEPRPRTRR